MPVLALSSRWSVQRNLFLPDSALESNCVWPQKEHTRSPASVRLEDKAHGSQIPGSQFCGGWDIRYRLLNSGLGVWGWFCCLVSVKAGVWSVQQREDPLPLLTSSQQKIRTDSALVCILFLPRCKLKVQSSKPLSPWRGKQCCLMQNCYNLKL